MMSPAISETSSTNEFKKADRSVQVERLALSAQHVTAATGGTKILHHPDIGELVLEWNILVCPLNSGRNLSTMRIRSYGRANSMQRTALR